jgi:branched-subunit amino acid transport protein AzlD
MVSLGDALVMTFVMGGVILFCRAVPFFFFRDRDKPPPGQAGGKAAPGKDAAGKATGKAAGKDGGIDAGGKAAPGDIREPSPPGRDPRGSFFAMVEKTAPPVAMTVLAFNALSGPLKEDFRRGLPVLVAAGCTALLHLWKRNPLISILGGTALYMILERVW